VRRGLLAGVAFVLAGLALEAGRRRDRRRWFVLGERLASLRRLMTVDYLAMQDFRDRLVHGHFPAWGEANLGDGYFCPAGEKYGASGERRVTHAGGQTRTG
jgi:hypothetical protein